MTALIPVFLSLFCPQTTGGSHDRIIFAAQRFGENLGNVYERGYSHLCSIGLDGRGLQQITSGKGFDFGPVPARDKRHLLFWRSVDADDPYDHGYHLYKVNIDGSGLIRVGAEVYEEYSEGLAHAVERASLGLRNGIDSIKAKTWDAFKKAGDLLYNPSGTKVIAYPKSENSDGKTVPDIWVGDLETRKVFKVVGGYRMVLWLGDDAMVCHAGTDSDAGLAILDSSGRTSVTANCPPTTNTPIARFVRIARSNSDRPENS